MLCIRSTAFFLLVSKAFGLENSFGAEILSAFHEWADLHGKEYDSHHEKMSRLQIWAENDGRW
jgi:Cathepsin propeptide inhibitor domain (I29)